MHDARKTSIRRWFDEIRGADGPDPLAAQAMPVVPWQQDDVAGPHLRRGPSTSSTHRPSVT
jgi:hypothetical protein